MTIRPKASGLLSRVNSFLFGKSVDERAVSAGIVRELMAVESVIRDAPALLVNTPSRETLALKDKAVSEKREAIASLSDNSILFLNELLPRFKDEERAQIIHDVTSGIMDDAQTHQYLELLEATADLSAIALVFDDDTFVNLVKGVSLRNTAKGISEEKLRSQKEVLVRFGMVMSLANRHGVSRGDFRAMYKKNAKDNGLVLRDPSLESVLTRNPENLEKITQLVISDPTMTGNRIGGIILTESRQGNTYTMHGQWS